MLSILVPTVLSAWVVPALRTLFTTQLSFSVFSSILELRQTEGVRPASMFASIPVLILVLAQLVPARGFGAAMDTLGLGLQVRTSAKAARGLALNMAAKPVLYDMPVSNNGARCRLIIYKKGIEDRVAITSPMDIGGLRSEVCAILSLQCCSRCTRAHERCCLRSTSL